MNLLSYIILILVVAAFVVAFRLAYFSHGKKSCCRGGDCEKCKEKYRRSKGV